MKFCTKCGNQLLDEAVICPKCGCMLEQTNTTIQKQVNISNDVKESEICPSYFRWLIAGFLGISYLGFILMLLLPKSALVILMITLMFQFAVIGMCVYGISRKWTHFLVGSKPYPIQFGLTLGATIFIAIIEILYYVFLISKLKF